MKAFVGRCRAARLPPRHRTSLRRGNPGEGVVFTPGLTKESASGALVGAAGLTIVGELLVDWWRRLVYVNYYLLLCGRF